MRSTSVSYLTGKMKVIKEVDLQPSSLKIWKNLEFCRESVECGELDGGPRIIYERR